MSRPLRSTDPFRLGGYELTARLGEGGQGVVYLGCAADGQSVAIKVLHAALGDEDRAGRQFMRELRAARRIDSFCTARIVDAVIGDDVAFIVTEYVEGPSLREAIKQRGPLSGGELDRLAIAMATALVAIHRAGVVHRDFKPGNVLLGPDGPRVIDFGIARLLDTASSSQSQIMGTPPFMAPEQFGGERVAPAADVFAWGCTVAYAANGWSPFDGDYIPEIINRILNDEPDLGDLKGPLRDVVAACLHKKPRRRPAAHQLLARLLGEETAWPTPMVSVSDHEERIPSWVLKPHVPNVARMYDYYLGGKDNFAADRAAADQVMAVIPNVLDFTRANRRFLARVVTLLARHGIRQFLDIGSGLPTQENVHEIAQRTALDSRVVYVDNDPVVLAHGRALLADNPLTTVVQADLRDPQGIIDNPEVHRLLDFDEPVAILMLAILHFIPDDAHPAQIVAALREPMVTGSYLAISHGHRGKVSKDVEKQTRGAYSKTAAGDIVPRTPEQILGYFEGMDVLQPGLVPVEAWRPESGPIETNLAKPGFFAVAGRKR
jgi:serine/threonine protein kinase